MYIFPRSKDLVLTNLSRFSFRVPKFWAQGYDKRASYIFNIRGHDFLSHTGRWKSEEEIKFMKRSEHIINEIDALRLLGEELEKKGHNKADLKLSLGPQPGSFFADAPKLCLYRFENLPRDLNNAIQLNQRKYGQISDVAMNANGGWVMHFRVRTWFNGRDHQFCWGGEEGLPNKLKEALQSGRNRRAKIRVCFPRFIVYSHRLTNISSTYSSIIRMQTNMCFFSTMVTRT